MTLILASASASRRAMLEAAGVAFRVVPAAVDEGQVKQAHRRSPVALAVQLARAKALDVSRRFAGEWVIGSDSLVVVDGRQFDKPRDRGEAASHLRFFSGKPMRLLSSVALARAGTVDWGCSATATLHVRSLSDRFIASYLDEEWPAVGGCVGVFRIESAGVQLFDWIRGDHFTILGMPLLPLLAALRERGLMTE